MADQKNSGARAEGAPGTPVAREASTIRATNIRRADINEKRRIPASRRQAAAAVESVLNSLRPSDFAERADYETAKCLARATLFAHGWDFESALECLEDRWAAVNGEADVFSASRFTRSYAEWSPDGLRAALPEDVKLPDKLYIDCKPVSWASLLRMCIIEHQGYSQRNKDKLFIDDLLGTMELAFHREMQAAIPYNFEARRFTDLVASGLPERQPFLIDGALRRGGEMILGGAKKTGKTHLMIELLLAASTGGQWLEWDVDRCKAMLLNCENDEGDVLNDIAEVAEQMSIDYRSLDLYVESYFGDEEPEIGNFFAGLESTVRELGIELLVIDPIYTLITSFNNLVGDAMDESSNKDVTRFLRYVRRLRERTGVAVVFATHFRKGNGGDVSDRLVGAGAWTRHATAAFYFAEIDLEDTEYPEDAVDEAIRFWHARRTLLARDIKPAEGCRSASELLFCARDELGDDFEAIYRETEKMRGPDHYKATPMRISCDLRHGDDSWSLDMWWCYPCYLRDAAGFLNEYSVKGTAAASRERRHKVAEKAKSRSRKAERDKPAKNSSPAQRIIDWLGNDKGSTWTSAKDIAAGTGLMKHEVASAADECGSLEHRRNKKGEFEVRRTDV